MAIGPHSSFYYFSVLFCTNSYNDQNIVICCCTSTARLPVELMNLTDPEPCQQNSGPPEKFCVLRRNMFFKGRQCWIASRVSNKLTFPNVNVQAHVVLLLLLTTLIISTARSSDTIRSAAAKNLCRLWEGLQNYGGP